MMQRRFREACSCIKERSYIKYAKIASASGLFDYNDIDLMIIKATPPDELPLDEKYIQRLLKLFSTCPSTCHSFAISFTRRFGTTRSWRVALKSLILLHRLLRSLPGNTSLLTQLLWTRSNSLFSLYPCHFKDDNSYTSFVISYAHLLDQALNCDLAVEEKQVLEMLPQLQNLIDRVMECCYPMAEPTPIVQAAMKLVIRDSFLCYTKFRREMVGILENMLEMPYMNCTAAFNIYKKAAIQTNELYEFYEWCKAKDLCGMSMYEYPLVDPIPYIQIKALETFLSGIWHLTPTTSPHHLLHAQEDTPLIQLEPEEQEQDTWETLLETSISFTQRDLFYHQHSFHQQPADTTSPTAASNPFSDSSSTFHSS